MVKWLERYEVLGVSRSADGENWRVDVGIRRSWPLYLFDHRPWERFPRKHFPVRTFVGRGLAWFEVVDGRYFGAGDHVSVLNAIISEHAVSVG